MRTANEVHAPRAEPRLKVAANGASGREAADSDAQAEHIPEASAHLHHHVLIDGAGALVPVPHANPRTEISERQAHRRDQVRERIDRPID